MDAVKRHYNARPQQDAEERKESPIFRLRLFNNWIKAVLIQRALGKLGKSTAVHVLDLACGKGGDLTKYRQSSQVKRYVGVDLANVSIEHAKERLSQGRFAFKAEFHVGNAFADPLDCTIVGDYKHSAQLVSCQFALHYAFKSKQVAEQAIENVSNALANGGIFICTIPNAQVLLERTSQGQATSSNQYYKVEFTGGGHQDDVYGREYTFWLSDAIDTCKEFLVLKDPFVELCERHGLRLVECLDFKLCYLKWGPEHVDLLRRMSVVDPDTNRLLMSRKEMDIAEMYDAFIFIKN